MNDSKIDEIKDKELIMEQLRDKGMNPVQIEEQIERFNKGYIPMKLKRPCTIGDGVHRFDSAKQEQLVSFCRDSLKSRKAKKFVPASGAASRMFRDLVSEYQQLKQNGDQDITVQSTEMLINNINRFAFSEDLKNSLSSAGYDIENLIDKKDYLPVLDSLLTENGMNYSNLPKGLIKFHKYADESRTAFEEHLVEGRKYIVKDHGTASIHFTVPLSFKSEIEKYLNEKTSRYDNGSVNFDLEFSVQSSSTDTIAVDTNNVPVLDQTGRLVFRPGGHGALLDNLDTVDADIIFIKNIDNVLAERFLNTITFYKMMLGGCLVELQDTIFGYLKRLEENNISDELFNNIKQFCNDMLFFNIDRQTDNMGQDEKKEYYSGLLNRPVRICGVVKNTGEPGGGPFWVVNENGIENMQIVESAQVDMNSDTQKAVWNSSTHFNPVDLVCGVRDYRGEKFSLKEYIDKEAGIITNKSFEGKDIKALELPGLWNGSMSNWITVFVEVPVETFSPVKTVFDLLRDEHQGC